MKLVNIELHNIGLYADQVILFPYGEKEAILFWGNNGAGKTTLLTSIKVGLLGQKAISGSFEKYCDFVSSNLISSRWDRTKGTASIRIAVELVVDNEKQILSILREWMFVDGILSEELSIYRRGEKLDFIQTEKIQNRINATLPPSLMDVLIFDGENAISLLQKDQMPVLIKNIIFSIYGMDLYAQTSKDLIACLKKIGAGSDAREDEIRSIEISGRYRQNINENKALKEIETDLITSRKNKITALDASVKRLSKIIGIDYRELELFKKDLTGLQDKQKKLQSEAKFICEEVLPLKILEKKLIAIARQTEAEKPFHMLKRIVALQEYFANDTKAASDLAELANKIEPLVNQENVLGLSDSEQHQINKAIGLLEPYKKETLLSFIDAKNSTFLTIKEKIGSLEKLSSPEAETLLEQIEKLSSELDDITEQIISLESRIKESDAQLEQSKKEYEENRKHLLQSKKSSNAYLSISLFRETIDEFILEKTKEICASLDQSICAELKRIQYRNSSIKQVKIDPKDFTISLYEFGGKLIPFSVFSAGEKQILLGLIIKESLKLAGIDGFFLFDTPVGRLDMSNRSIFTNEVIFKVAEQVMVFATDSDYSKSDYMAIKDRLTQERLLSRNGNDEIVLCPGSIYGETK